MYIDICVYLYICIFMCIYIWDYGGHQLRLKCAQVHHHSPCRYVYTPVHDGLHWPQRQRQACNNIIE